MAENKSYEYERPVHYLSGNARHYGTYCEIDQEQVNKDRSVIEEAKKELAKKIANAIVKSDAIKYIIHENEPKFDEKGQLAGFVTTVGARVSVVLLGGNYGIH